MHNILIIEDEARIAVMIAEYLEAKGFCCFSEHNGKAGIACLEREAIDLTLIDWMLPGMSGPEVASRIRQVSDIPIIMLTAKDAEADKVLGLESGADDYMTKPFSLKELTARVHAHLRRYKGTSRVANESDELRVSPFRLNYEKRKAWKNDTELNLTTMRFDLLAMFMENPDKVFTREEIMERLACEGFYDGFDRTIDAHIKNLRKIVEHDTSKPRYIQTVRGLGYRFIVGAT